MAPSLLLGAALIVSSRGSDDETSMLQAPMLAKTVQTESDESECRCPGYYQEQCEQEAAQGCRWSDAGSSNGPWCQCLADDIRPPPAPPVAPLAGASQYLGCFIDDADRDFDHGPGASAGTGYTFATCKQACEDDEDGPTVYMSLQYGGECFCQNTYSTASQYSQVSDSECSMVREPCSSASHSCGGTWRNAVYQLLTAAVPPVAPTAPAPVIVEPVIVTLPPPVATAAPEPDDNGYGHDDNDYGHIAVAGPPMAVLIDNSNENTKCVTASVPVICADDAGHLGNRLNTHQAGDTFAITVDGAEVCATRTDSSGGWGMHLEIACVAAPVHILIDSSDENTKCVTHSFPVSCAGDAGHLENRINSHQAGDTFDITTNGAEVCATRTDSSGGWGMHLEIACVATGAEEGPIVSAPVINVLVDNSNTNIKCVETAVPVVCADDAGHLGNRINSHQAGDTFEITTDGTQVCARRTDSSGGWGMHLEFACVAAPVHILIDSSSENTKCVTSSLPVICADDAGHLGNRVNSHQAGDTFEITTDGNHV
jgi:hypothetical protein